MPFLPSLPATAHLADLFRLFPANVAPLMAYTDGLLRGEGVLDVAEREMIATYTSGLNACTFCTGSHKIYAKLFGFDGDLMDAMIADLDGMLRNHQRASDGTLRDTAVYSITADEWPTVRSHLDWQLVRPR